jgi:hypothetical protein
MQTLCQAMAKAKGGLEQRRRRRVEQLVEALAAGVQAAVAAVLQQSAREVEDLLHQLAVAIRGHVQGVQDGIGAAFLAVALEQEAARKGLRLRAVGQAIFLAEQVEHAVEAVQHGDPVVGITAGKRPVAREGGEMGRQLVQRDRLGGADKVGDHRRLHGLDAILSEKELAYQSGVMSRRRLLLDLHVCAGRSVGGSCSHAVVTRLAGANVCEDG